MGLFALVLIVFSISHAAEMGIPVQLRLKSPSGVYPTESNVTMKLQVLSLSGCVLREETFSNQSVVDGAVSLNLGSGIRSGYDPNISLNAAFDNATPKSALTCLNALGAVVSTNQNYTPIAGDIRQIRFSAVILSDTILADFPIKSVPYAIHAESVGGKSGADILVQNLATQLNQTNLESLLADSTKLTNLQNLANTGAAISATTAVTATNATNSVNSVNATTAINFSGSLAGDVSGIQSVVSVNKIKGVPVSATAPTTVKFCNLTGLNMCLRRCQALRWLLLLGKLGS